MSGCGPPESPLNVSTGGHQWPALSNARYTDARPIFSVRAISTIDTLCAAEPIPAQSALA